MSAAAHTRMFQEAASAAHCVRAQLSEDAANLQAITTCIRSLAPRAVVTCARGSSDHAATYAKYLIETHARVLTASAAPSVSSVYGITQNLEGCLFIAISQSGQSPDLLAAVARARRTGATVLALCNNAASPLVEAADLVMALHAGPETAVAATKSFLATLAALARLVAAWTGDSALLAALQALPAQLEAGWALDWSAALEPLLGARNLYVIGRGVGLGAAQEIALKFKETCGLHAEAFSSAEVKHGPYALLAPDFPALLLAQDDASRPGLEALATELAQRRVPLLINGARIAGCTVLPGIAAAAVLQPILAVQSAYRLIAELSVRRGFDPDQPPHLKKVTETM